MKMITNLILTLVVSLALVGCSAFDTAASILTPSNPTPICEIPPVPSLPASDGQGLVTLEPQHQEALLLYIVGLEDCVDQLR